MKFTERLNEVNPTVINTTPVVDNTSAKLVELFGNIGLKAHEGSFKNNIRSLQEKERTKFLEGRGKLAVAEDKIKEAKGIQSQIDAIPNIDESKVAKELEKTKQKLVLEAARYSGGYVSDTMFKARVSKIARDAAIQYPGYKDAIREITSEVIPDDPFRFAVDEEIRKRAEEDKSAKTASDYITKNITAAAQKANMPATIYYLPPEKIAMATAAKQASDQAVKDAKDNYETHKIGVNKALEVTKMNVMPNWMDTFYSLTEGINLDDKVQVEDAVRAIERNKQIFLLELSPYSLAEDYKQTTDELNGLAESALNILKKVDTIESMKNSFDIRYSDEFLRQNELSRGQLLQWYVTQKLINPTGTPELQGQMKKDIETYSLAWDSDRLSKNSGLTGRSGKYAIFLRKKQRELTPEQFVDIARVGIPTLVQYHKNINELDYQVKQSLSKEEKKGFEEQRDRQTLALIDALGEMPNELLTSKRMSPIVESIDSNIDAYLNNISATVNKFGLKFNAKGDKVEYTGGENLTYDQQRGIAALQDFHNKIIKYLSASTGLDGSTFVKRHEKLLNDGLLNDTIPDKPAPKPVQDNTVNDQPQAKETTDIKDVGSIADYIKNHDSVNNGDAYEAWLKDTGNEKGTNEALFRAMEKAIKTKEPVSKYTPEAQELISSGYALSDIKEFLGDKVFA